jgi:5-bromo-4-chloroindolyl phosphate hydrolysis protein
MESRDQHEREIRAARNQSLFRAVNEKVKEMDEAFVSMTGTFAIACECADMDCIETLKISPAEYAEVRANPRHFAVLPDHIYPEVEEVVRTSAQYVVVEKIAKAAEIAELLAEPNEG